VVAPGHITDITYDNSTSSILLQWTAPGDDSTLSQSGLVDYGIRKSGSTINDSNWGSADSVTATIHQSNAGSTDYVTIPGLSSCTTYHFNMWAKDDNGRASPRTGDFTAETFGWGGGCDGGGGLGGSAQHVGAGL